MKAAVPSRRTGLALAVGLLLAPGLARGWWNEEWSGRKLFSIDTSAAGGNISDPIGRVPVLFRLHAGNFRFDAAKEDGSDLRFVAGDDKTPLPFHIEKYDSLLAEALVWVSLPDLKPGARTNVWLYYKNPKAVAAEDAKGTYDPSTVLVYHFADAAGQSPHDSSAFANHAATAGAASENALIGRGLRLDGQSTVTVPATPSLDWPAGAKLTLSVWIHPAEANETGVLFSRRDGTSALVVGTESGKPYVALESASGAVRAEAKEALAAGGWHQLSITAGEAVALYVDGAPAASAAGALPALATSALIGGDLAPAPPPRAPQKKLVKGAREVEPPAPPPPPGFKGDLDELELAKVERPAGFL
ncbi:MAG TPA: DUF2341 domain-containing protein, partial [Anaeromyxobacteraceae bacterium]|nr:DUF2341 domain-containing protein [Anaeromyxobacteraceae bacterium]